MQGFLNEPVFIRAESAVRGSGKVAWKAGGDRPWSRPGAKRWPWWGASRSFAGNAGAVVPRSVCVGGTFEDSATAASAVVATLGAKRIARPTASTSAARKGATITAIASGSTSND